MVCIKDVLYHVTYSISVGQVLIFYMHDHGLFDWWKNRGDPCSLYADDTTIFLRNLSNLSQTIRIIMDVGSFTGLHLNLSKTIAFVMAGGRRIVAGIEVDSRPVKYLGTFLGLDDLSEMNFNNPLSKAQNNSHSWNKRNLTLSVRVLVSKTFIASIFIHTLNSVFVHTHQIQLIQQLLNDFLWRGRPRICQSTVCVPLIDGRLNMMHVKNVVHGLQVKWFQ